MKNLIFKNSIVKGKECGFLNCGRIHNLVNSDSKKRYRVTVETIAKQGAIITDKSQKTYIINAGGTKALGCSCSQYTGGYSYARRIVGEVVI